MKALFVTASEDMIKDDWYGNLCLVTFNDEHLLLFNILNTVLIYKLQIFPVYGLSNRH